MLLPCWWRMNWVKREPSTGRTSFHISSFAPLRLIRNIQERTVCHCRCKSLFVLLFLFFKFIYLFFRFTSTGWLTDGFTLELEKAYSAYFSSHLFIFTENISRGWNKKINNFILKYLNVETELHGCVKCYTESFKRIFFSVIALRENAVRHIRVPWDFSGINYM